MAAEQTPESGRTLPTRRGTPWPHLSLPSPPASASQACGACKSAGNTCTSRSTTAPAWRTPRFSDRKAITVVAFLRRAAEFYARHGITVEQLLTDNGAGYLSTIHAIACRTLRIGHLGTRAYRPQTNGKAERFIRTVLNGRAYGAIYRHSTERTAALDGWLWHYNHHRKHSALAHQPPIARLNERTNLLGTYK